jgi:hypothetical protein
MLGYTSIHPLTRMVLTSVPECRRALTSTCSLLNSLLALLFTFSAYYSPASVCT